GQADDERYAGTIDDAAVDVPAQRVRTEPECLRRRSQPLDRRNRLRIDRPHPRREKAHDDHDHEYRSADDGGWMTPECVPEPTPCRRDRRRCDGRDSQRLRSHVNTVSVDRIARTTSPPPG